MLTRTEEDENARTGQLRFCERNDKSLAMYLKDEISR